MYLLYCTLTTIAALAGKNRVQRTIPYFLIEILAIILASSHASTHVVHRAILLPCTHARYHITGLSYTVEEHFLYPTAVANELLGRATYPALHLNLFPGALVYLHLPAVGIPSRRYAGFAG